MLTESIRDTDTITRTLVMEQGELRIFVSIVKLKDRWNIKTLKTFTRYSWCVEGMEEFSLHRGVRYTLDTEEGAFAQALIVLRLNGFDVVG